MPKKTPPFKEYPTWTEARFWSFIRSALRRTMSRWPPKIEAKKKARRAHTGDNKRQKWEYQCDSCKGWFMDKETEMDHLVECGSLRCYEDLHGFVERLFVGEHGWRCVCKKCHREITRQQREAKKNEKV